MPSRPAALIAALLLAASCTAVSEVRGAELLGVWAWRSDAPHHGGYSGLELGADGRDMVVISDRGRIVTGRLSRDPSGRIDGVRAGPIRRLRNVRGGVLPDDVRGDSEGLAQTPDGGIAVSFEGRTRVDLYETPSSPARPLPRPSAFRDLEINAALEGLAADAGGALWTLPEAPGPDGAFPLWRYADGGWSQPSSVPARDDFSAVGLDFDDRGRLYLLERRFALVGFATRVRRLTLTGTRITGEETLLQTPVGRHDNLEGISVWRDGAGRLTLTMVSDDNFRKLLQRTEFVEYRVPG